MTLGDRLALLRQEQFHDPAMLDDDQRSRSVIHRARVDVIEWLGDEQLVYLPYETPERIHRQLVELGRELDVELAFDPATPHLFDPATGNNLASEPEPAAR